MPSIDAGEDYGVVEYKPTRHAPKSLCVAWLLWLPPFGLLGLHRMYVGQWALGVYYFLTGGNAALGWLLDICRINGLVRSINRSEDGRVPLHPFDLFVASLPPAGLLGAARAHLGHATHAAMYFLTAGGTGLMWLLDLFRMPCLYRQFQQQHAQEDVDDKKQPASLLEAYLLLLVCPAIGLLGGHRFYLGHIGIGLLYFFTGGLFGFGFLYDCVALYWVVKAENQRRAATSGYALATTNADDVELASQPPADGPTVSYFDAHAPALFVAPKAQPDWAFPVAVPYTGGFGDVRQTNI